jgi:surfeit locus 1 family protein
MIRRMIWPLIFGMGGVAILVSLGVWQVQRLAWKEGVLAEIEARIAAAPEALPERPIPSPIATCRWPRREFGTGSRPRSGQPAGQGAQYRVISPFETGTGASWSTAASCRPKVRRPCTRGPSPSPGTCTGREEVDGFTPAPDLARNIWYARDVDALAAHLAPSRS